MRIERCKPACNATSFAGAAYQDKRYGFGKRVKNPCPGPGGSVVYRCTVCGDSPVINGGPASQKRKAMLAALKIPFKLYQEKCRSLSRNPISSKRGI